MQQTEQPAGGRAVDEKGINSGILRCHRCSVRMLTQRGKLVQRTGDDASLWTPGPPKVVAPTTTTTPQPTAMALAFAGLTEEEVRALSVSELKAGLAESGVDVAARHLTEKSEIVALALSSTETAQRSGVAEGSVVDAPQDQQQQQPAVEYDWTRKSHEWWWIIPDVNDVDSIGLSYAVQSPMGLIRCVVCTDCHLGPMGYRVEGEQEVWLVAEFLAQQDVSCADDAEDFKMPDGMDMSALKAMLESGCMTVAFDTIFEEQRLGMMLQDVNDTPGAGVEVVQFSSGYEGTAGPVEQSGKVELGDRITRVDGKNTEGLGYEKVLEMIIDGPRPITIHWERAGKGIL